MVRGEHDNGARRVNPDEFEINDSNHSDLQASGIPFGRSDYDPVVFFAGGKLTPTERPFDEIDGTYRLTHLSNLFAGIDLEEARAERERLERDKKVPLFRTTPGTELADKTEAMEDHLLWYQALCEVTLRHALENRDLPWSMRHPRGLRGAILSPRQLTILSLMGHNLREFETVQALGITVDIVSAEKTHMYQRLGVTNALGALIAGRERGYLADQLLKDRFVNYGELYRLTPRQRQMFDAYRDLESTTISVDRSVARQYGLSIRQVKAAKSTILREFGFSNYIDIYLFSVGRTGYLQELRSSEFSEEERAVLEGIGRGYTDDMVVKGRGMPLTEVRRVKQMLFDRFGVNNTAAVLTHALRQGIMSGTRDLLGINFNFSGAKRMSEEDHLLLREILRHPYEDLRIMDLAHDLQISPELLRKRIQYLELLLQVQGLPEVMLHYIFSHIPEVAERPDRFARELDLLVSDDDKVILNLIIGGESRKDIARRVSISEDTLNRTIRGLVGRIHAESIEHAALLALDGGLLPIDDAELIRRFRGRLEKPRERRAEREVRITEPVVPTEIPYGLLPREVEYLELIQRGMSNTTIAEVLDRSLQTVENTITEVVKKLGALNRSHAAALAHERGIVDAEDRIQTTDTRILDSLTDREKDTILRYTDSTYMATYHLLPHWIISKLGQLSPFQLYLLAKKYRREQEQKEGDDEDAEY